MRVLHRQLRLFHGSITNQPRAHQEEFECLRGRLPHIHSAAMSSKSLSKFSVETRTPGNDSLGDVVRAVLEAKQIVVLCGMVRSLANNPSILTRPQVLVYQSMPEFQPSEKLVGYMAKVIQGLDFSVRGAYLTMRAIV